MGQKLRRGHHCPQTHSPKAGEPSGERGCLLPSPSQGRATSHCPHLRLFDIPYVWPPSLCSFLKPSPLSLDLLCASPFLWKLHNHLSLRAALSPDFLHIGMGAKTLGHLTQVWPGDPGKPGGVQSETNLELLWKLLLETWGWRSFLSSWLMRG